MGIFLPLVTFGAQRKRLQVSVSSVPWNFSFSQVLVLGSWSISWLTNLVSPNATDKPMKQLPVCIWNARTSKKCETNLWGGMPRLEPEVAGNPPQI